MSVLSVENCLKKVSSHFELILIAAQRAKELAQGQVPLVDREHSSNAVLALREIAESKLDIPKIRESIVNIVNQKFIDAKLAEEEENNSIVTDDESIADLLVVEEELDNKDFI